MAATEQGVWDLQDVRDKQLQSEWSYDGATQLMTWGYNNTGNLGLNQGGPGNDKSSPTQLPGTWQTYWYSMTNSAASKNYDSGTGGYDLWTWGNNSAGILGLNDYSSWPNYQNTRSSPTQVGTDTNWAHVHGPGSGTILGVKTDGSLWTWGNQDYGRGGKNNQIAVSSPTQVGTDTTWQARDGMDNKITGGSADCLAIKTDGTLWIWGRNFFGSLGLNQGPPWNVGKSSPTQVGTDTNWQSVGHTSGYHHFCKKTDGTLWVWGYGQQGMNCQNNTNSYSSPRQVPGDWTGAYIEGSNYSGHAIKADGTLWSWGGGPSANGTTGLNNMVQYSSPVQVGTDTNWGPANVAHQQTSLSAGGGYVMARKTDGTLWVWGRGNYGRTGLNTTINYSSPVQIPGDWSGCFAGSDKGAATMTL